MNKLSDPLDIFNCKVPLCQTSAQTSVSGTHSLIIWSLIWTSVLSWETLNPGLCSNKPVLMSHCKHDVCVKCVFGILLQWDSLITTIFCCISFKLYSGHTSHYDTSMTTHLSLSDNQLIILWVITFFFYVIFFFGKDNLVTTNI